MRDIEEAPIGPDFEGEIGIGEAVLDSRRNQLLVAGEVRALEPRLVRLLLTLAAARGAPVTRDSLLSAVSSLPYAGDEALTQAISKLRQALGDTPKTPGYIKTIPRKGYALIAPVGVVRDTPEPVRQKTPVPTLARAYQRRTFPVPLILSLVILLLSALVAWLVLFPKTWERETELIMGGDQQFEEKPQQDFIEKKDADPAPGPQS